MPHKHFNGCNYFKVLACLQNLENKRKNCVDDVLVQNLIFVVACHCF